MDKDKEIIRLNLVIEKLEAALADYRRQLSRSYTNETAALRTKELNVELSKMEQKNKTLQEKIKSLHVNFHMLQKRNALAIGSPEPKFLRRFDNLNMEDE